MRQGPDISPNMLLNRLKLQTGERRLARFRDR